MINLFWYLASELEELAYIFRKDLTQPQGTVSSPTPSFYLALAAQHFHL
jgi:hypothetical protein